MKTALILLIIAIWIPAESKARQMTPVPFTSTNWDFGQAPSSTQNYMGKESYMLNGFLISTKNVGLLNGTIELDINFPYARFFPSMLFRLQDGENSESFYVRPHQSGNPDATQYTPVFNSYAGWQLYHGPGYSAAVELAPDVWHHVKIDILNDQADIYFDDMETPLMQVTDLKRDPVSGEIGLSSGAPVYFANVQYTKKEPRLTKREPVEEDLPEGLITEWKISDVVSNEEYQGKPMLNFKNLTWTKQPAEASGTINLAKFVQSTDDKTTVIAKLDISADKETRKEIVFGYSDFVWVYVNGEAIYGGRNDFLSRDYRYLGTIGWFDSVYLPLKKGKNDIMFVVGENFGGWGLKAYIADRSGITIQ